MEILAQAVPVSHSNSTMEDAFPSPAASTLPSASTSAFHAVTGGRAGGSIGGGGGGGDAATGAGGGAGAGAGAGGQGLGDDITGFNAASAEILRKLTYTDRVEEAKRLKTLAGALQDCTPTVSYGEAALCGWVGGFKGW